ncbi:hypothetical protein [Rheinheimera mangrovi]|uniref:hypothetical protein n=1 Tax=Rheinheimera mangrovi TaxID=2498451 RepID=UPI000F8DDD75|nr:hypothetical protein [Rheinheimera mangrovi]
MRVFSFVAMLAFSPALLAADFQVDAYVLGAAKASLSAELQNEKTVTLFEAAAKVETQWTEDKLSALQLNYYQGPDYTLLQQKTSLLLTQLSSKFGAVAWVSSETDATTVQSTEQHLGIVEQVMKTADKISADYKTSHLANTRLVLDFQPEPQPDNSRLHLQISYSSISSEYSLMLFVDEKTAVERTATAVVNLEAF